MHTNPRTLLNRWTTPIWPVVVLAIGAGGALGALAADEVRPAEVSALIRVYQPVDPDQVITGAVPTSDTLQTYISGEIAYLSSPGFSDEVARHLNQTAPAAVTATQDAQSSIINLSAAQPDPDAAERTVDAAIAVYRDHLQVQSRERGQSAIDVLTQVIGELQDPAATGQADESATGQVDESATGPQARIDQLELQRLSIEIQNRRAAAMQVVQPPTVLPQAGVPMPLLAAVGGGLLAGLLAIAAAHLWHRRSGVVTDRRVLEAQIRNVMVPTVRVGAVNDSDDAYFPLARKLFAQIPNRRSGRILILGASSDSGSGYVTDLIASAAMELGDVHIVRLHRGSATLNDVVAERARTGALGADDIVLVDGGSIESSPSLVDAVKNSDQIVVVAMIGRDVTDSIRMARQLAVHGDTPIAAVCTRRSRPWRQSTTVRASEHPSAPSDGPTATDEPVSVSATSAIESNPPSRQ